MKKRTKTIMLFSSAISVGAAVATTTCLASNNFAIENINDSKSLIVDSTINASNSDYPIYASQSNGQNSFLSTKSGPIIYSNNLITALNWFGGKRWEINMETETNLTSYGSASWKRSWYNWDYDQNRDILWVLSYGAPQNKNSNFPQQKLFAYRGSDGTRIGVYNLEGEYTEYKFITALSSGNVLIYGGATSSYDATVQLYNCNTNKISIVNGNSDEGLVLPTKPDGTQYDKGHKWYFFNVVPIANNMNIVELMHFPSGSGTDNDGSKDKASFRIDFLLVDDNMNFITRDKDNKWSKQFNVVPEGVVNYRNTKTTPQRDYYFLLDGTVVTVLYNTIVMINPNDSSSDCGVSVKTYQLDPTKWVMSWSFDTNENLFYKYKDDSTIYRVKASELKNNNSNLVSPATYYSLANSTNEEVKKYANNYILYNVYGYQGQIMLINSWYENTVTVRKYTDTENMQQYGLAVAIVQNEHNNEVGDVKGILNGEKSFQQSADFNINDEILSSKIPSEITKNDLTITNNGFLTENKITENNELKYKPFEITNIDDKTGTFTITANIDQIPWFANVLPSDAIPTKITKTFNGTNGNNKALEINKKISWKSLTENDYDFVNTLPSKVNVNDIKNFDPFQVSFNSQVILDNSGNQIYPNKSYKVNSYNDSNGTIDIEVTYEYIPLGVVYNGNSSIKTHTEVHQYNIFSNKKTPEFYFAGSDQKASSTSQTAIDIKTVPQLKTLSQSNLLPSSFTKMDNTSFEQFINTNKSIGYPLSRMNFDVIADDLKGTLTIIATLQSGYYTDSNIPTSFTQVYTGLNKSTSYNFAFIETAKEINSKPFSAILPSAVNEGDVVNDLIKYTGFNSSDFTINLFPNNDEGKLNVEINLNKSYAYELGNSNGFKDYRTSFEFSGFMNTENYNNQYLIEFKANNDASLAKIKQLTLSQINNSLTGSSSKGLQIGENTYTNLKSFVQKELIASIGEKIPSDDWSSNNNIDIKMTYDNNAGTMNILLTIKKEILSGLESDINVVASYSGFAKGNINETQDNLSFIDNDLLKSIVDNANNVSASEFAKWLNDSNENFKKIVSHVSGIYETLINNKEYKLELTPNDSYGTLSVTIIFDDEKVTDKQSLTTYSIQYTNLFS